MSNIIDWETRKSEAEIRANYKLNWDSDKLKKFRNLLGFSQNEFCNLIGIHQVTLSNYEKGRTVGDTVTMEKILNACDKWKENKIRLLEAEIRYIKTF